MTFDKFKCYFAIKSYTIHRPNVGSCWTIVCDAGPTLTQHFVGASCLLCVYVFFLHVYTTCNCIHDSKGRVELLWVELMPVFCFKKNNKTGFNIPPARKSEKINQAMFRLTSFIATRTSE